MLAIGGQIPRTFTPEVLTSSASRNMVDGFVCLLFAAGGSRAFNSFETSIESVSVITVR